MDEGVKTAELMFKAAIALKETMLRMTIALLKAAIKHMEWLKQQNIKPFWKERIDKLEIGTTKALAGMIEKDKNLHQEKIHLKERQLDKFKLDKQYELENYKTEIYKAQKALDLAREGKDDVKTAEKQIVLDTALERKKEFEYKTNKELMAKNHELDVYKNKLNEIEYDLKVCNAKLNALNSNRNIETGRLKNEYQNTKNKYISQELNFEKESPIVPTLNIDKYKENFNEDVKKTFVEDIDNFQMSYEKVKKSIDKNNTENDYTKEEYYDGLEVSVDNLLNICEKTEKDIDLLEKDTNNKIEEKSINDDVIKKDNEKIDKVESMLSKDDAALKIYKENKEKGNFNIANVDKDLASELSR